jgi:methyl-accepting chemotaxis protein
MAIRTKMFLLLVLAVIGFFIVISSAVLGMRQMDKARNHSENKADVAYHLLEIKASALSTILLDPTAESTFQIFRDAEANIRVNSEVLQKIADQGATRAMVADIIKSWETYDKESHTIFRLAKTDPQAANKELNVLYERDFKPLQKIVESAVTAEAKEADKARASVAEVAAVTLWLVILPLAVLAIVLLVIVYKISQDLKRSLQEVFAALKQLGTGDLTTRLPDQSKDEIGSIAGAVNEFIRQTHEIVSQLRDGALRISEASTQLAVASDQIAADSREQSEAASAMAATVEQVTTSINQVSDHAKDAYSVSQDSNKLSVGSSEVVHAAVNEMAQISASVRESSAVIQQLGKRSGEITVIVNTIKDIADQTNLLALNAAIEAARAGEQGRGFAVVADEVRKLAERTAHSTSEIASMIQKIQADTESAVRSMDEGVKRVDEGAVLAAQAEEAIAKMRDSTGHVMEVIDNITMALGEQTKASNDIAVKVEQIAHMTEENDLSVQNNNSAVQGLKQLSDSLEELVSHYRLEGALRPS